MKIKSFKNNLSGSVRVPGSKSHTIRALLLAAMANGSSYIKNPLPSADCLSTMKALPHFGAEVEIKKGDTPSSDEWIVKGAGPSFHLSDDVIDVGNSGSLLYFLSPIAATFDGWSVFTGDASIRKRPVFHVVDALKQLGAQAYTRTPEEKGCPLIIKGPISSEKKVTTTGDISSQYISGLMMSAIRMKGILQIDLTDPKETPYLLMTQDWLKKVGVECSISEDFKHIEVKGGAQLKSFDTNIPSDWEAVAFPLLAAIISDSQIVIEGIDSSASQGDQEIVSVFQKIGADITWNKDECRLYVKGLKKSKDGLGRLTTENLPGNELHVAMSPFPDAICALAVAACFTEGTTILEDAAVCRRKETDRIKVLKCELEKLGAQIEEGEDFMIIHGHSPYLKDGSSNPAFSLHGGQVESYDDHRVAMSLACLGLGLKDGESVTVNNAQCAWVSFPDFYKVMNGIGAVFSEVEE